MLCYNQVWRTVWLLWLVNYMEPQSNIFFRHGATAPIGPGPPQCLGLRITLRHTTLGGTPPEGWSAQRNYLYLTTPNSHNKHTPMPPVGFEPTIPASQWLQKGSLGRAYTGIGHPVTLPTQSLVLILRVRTAMATPRIASNGEICMFTFSQQICIPGLNRPR